MRIYEPLDGETLESIARNMETATKGQWRSDLYYQLSKGKVMVVKKNTSFEEIFKAMRTRNQMLLDGPQLTLFQEIIALRKEFLKHITRIGRADAQNDPKFIKILEKLRANLFRLGDNAHGSRYTINVIKGKQSVKYGI